MNKHTLFSAEKDMDSTEELPAEGKIKLYTVEFFDLYYTKIIFFFFFF